MIPAPKPTTEILPVTKTSTDRRKRTNPSRIRSVRPGTALQARARKRTLKLDLAGLEARLKTDDRFSKAFRQHWEMGLPRLTSALTKAALWAGFKQDSLPPLTHLVSETIYSRVFVAVSRSSGGGFGESLELANALLFVAEHHLRLSTTKVAALRAISDTALLG